MNRYIAIGILAALLFAPTAGADEQADEDGDPALLRHVEATLAAEQTLIDQFDPLVLRVTLADVTGQAEIALLAGFSPRFDSIRLESRRKGAAWTPMKPALGILSAFHTPQVFAKFQKEVDYMEVHMYRPKPGDEYSFVFAEPGEYELRAKCLAQINGTPTWCPSKSVVVRVAVRDDDERVKVLRCADELGPARLQVGFQEKSSCLHQLEADLSRGRLKLRLQVAHANAVMQQAFLQVVAGKAENMDEEVRKFKAATKQAEPWTQAMYQPMLVQHYLNLKSHKNAAREMKECELSTQEFRRLSQDLATLGKTRSDKQK